SRPFSCPKSLLLQSAWGTLPPSMPWPVGWTSRLGWPSRPLPLSPTSLVPEPRLSAPACGIGGGIGRGYLEEGPVAPAGRPDPLRFGLHPPTDFRPPVGTFELGLQTGCHPGQERGSEGGTLG